MPPRRNSFFGRTQSSSPFASIFGGNSRGLSSLFGGQKSQGWSGIFGSGMGSQGGAGGITGMISNTQKAIETVQKVAPVVQQVRQYGPLIRNLPSMYKMIKAIRSSSSDDDEETKKADADDSGKNELRKTEQNLKIDLIQTRNTKVEEKKSVPKFFVPGTR